MAGGHSSATLALRQAIVAPGAFSRLAGGSSVKSIASSSVAGSAYGERPQSARTSAEGRSEAPSGYRKLPLTARGPRSAGGFSVSTASFSQDRMPWLKGDINDAAGMASWEGSPRLKGFPFELDQLGNQPCKMSGSRHYPHHPLTKALHIQEAIHGYKFLDYRPPNHFKEEPEWVEPAAGKSGLDVTNSGQKLTKGSDLHRGQVDRIIFGHDTYLRPTDHPQVELGATSAGWPTWRERPGLDTTLKVTGALGSPDGYRRQGRKPKAQLSEGGESALSHRHRGKKHLEVSQQNSVLNAVNFNGDKPLLTHTSQEFLTTHKGAAGKGSATIGREQHKNACHVVTRHDQLSVCSKEYGCRSLHSSQSMPALAVSPRLLSVTSSAAQGKDTRLHTSNRASPRV